MHKARIKSFLKRSLLLLFSLSFFVPHLKAQVTPSGCNIPLVGVSRVVDNISGNLVNLLDGSQNMNNLVNGNLNDSVKFDMTVSIATPLTPVSLVSIKDLRTSYASGTRVGFVVRSPGGISVDIGSGFRIKTYRNNVLQETISSPTVETILLTGRQRISFVSAKEFDEVELLQSSTIAALTSLDVFYAFVEQATGCNFNCLTPITKDNYPSATSTSGTLGGMLCTGCSVTGSNNLLNSALTDYATISLPLSVGGSGYVSVLAKATIPAGVEVGFALAPSAGGLLDDNLLDATTIATYSNGSSTPTESKAHSAGSLDVALLSGNIQLLKFKTTKSFDEVRLTINATLLSTTHVYYACIIEATDTDNDGVPDCADNCPGSDDNLDSNGNGVPDGCDNTCNFSAGEDVNLCIDQTSYDLSTRNLGSDLTWSILPESAPGATVTSTGLVQDMINLGSYFVEVTDVSGCKDTVAIVRQQSAISLDCNNPISGTNTVIFDPAGGACLLCLPGEGSENPNNVIDANLDNYLEFESSLSLLSATPIVGVRDTSQVYEAGRRTGFVVSVVGQLLDATMLQNFEIQTYLNGVHQESGTLLTSSVLPGTGNKQRISFVTTKPFDAVVLVDNSAVSLLSSIRIYYAFEEPAAGCDALNGDGCLEYLLADSPYKAQIESSHTGISGAACVNCNIENLGNLLDDDPTNYTEIVRTLGLATQASVSIKTAPTIGTDCRVGFAISGGSNLLDLSALNGIQMTTYNNGSQVDTYSANNLLVDVTLIGGSSDVAWITFQPTAPFNEIQLSISGVVSGLDSDVRVYGAFIRRDSDGDGVPDCIDKCCRGNDNLDTDGDGIPDACDINVAYDASCVQCPVSVTLSGNGLLPGMFSYFLFNGAVQVGQFDASSQLTFTSNKSGNILYTLKLEDGAGTFTDLQNVPMVIHPALAQWKSTAMSSVWKDGTNWTPNDAGTGGHPIWCTDVVIPETASVYPTLQSGDECRDITFKSGASVGQIQQLKYRHAFVELKPERNRWTMLSAPLRYMYSGDYHADMSWTDAISPKIFMRYFDVRYSTESKPNPDGKVGTSTGNFSRAFAELEEPLQTASGFVLWVNGTPYDDDNFPEGDSYQFPRRNSADSTDVPYSYHTSDGAWVGSPFYMPNRGNNIFSEPEWTESSIPDVNNRYRFIYEEKVTGNSPFNVPLLPGMTNIVGNPFMSHLDFDEFSNKNNASIYNYYRIWDGNQFYSYIHGSGSQVWTDLDELSTTGTDAASNRYIAPMQAFFVETKAGATQVTFTPESSQASATVGLRKSSPVTDLLRLHLKMDGMESHAILACRENASNNYDPQEDVYKLLSSLEDVPEIYTVSNGVAIEINAVGTSSTQQRIPIGIKTNRTGVMSMYVTGVENMVHYPEVYLIDSEMNREYDLKTVDSIQFEKTLPSDLEGRFYVRLSSGNSSIDHEDLNDYGSVDAYADAGQLIVNSGAGKIISLQLYNVSGSIQYEDTHVNDYYVRLSPKVIPGIYLLKIKTETGTHVFRLKF